MNIKWRTLLLAMAIPLATGALSGFLAGDSQAGFQLLRQPPYSPPGAVFPVVWTILFLLMGIASYLVYTTQGSSIQRTSALTLYGVQLVVNFFWSIFFFRFHWYFFSLLWILLLWVLIFHTMTKFYAISKAAGLLLSPYLLWVTFATYLTSGIVLLN